MVRKERLQSMILKHNMELLAKKSARCLFSVAEAENVGNLFLLLNIGGWQTMIKAF